MLIELRKRNVPVESETREWIERRVHFALGRFAERIRRVAVIVSDINGARGGTDIECHLRISLIPKGEVRILDLDSSVEAVVASAVDRAALCVARWLERHREFRDLPERVIFCQPRRCRSDERLQRPNICQKED